MALLRQRILLSPFRTTLTHGSDLYYIYRPYESSSTSGQAQGAQTALSYNVKYLSDVYMVHASISNP